MNRLTLAVALAGTVAVALPRAARAQAGSVPPSHMPPPGMCRIWIDGVPPGQQPAPTDCATAVRNRPANARVIFGDDAHRKKIRGDRGAWKDRVSLFGNDAPGDRPVFPKLGGRNEASAAPLAADAPGAGGALPDMAWAAAAARGQRPAGLARWLGGQSAAPQLADANGDGVPDRVVWVDDAGRTVQVWTDRDGDGRADRVELYRDGRRVNVIGR